MGALPLLDLLRFAPLRLPLTGAGLAGFAPLREECCNISISSSLLISFGSAASTSGSMACTQRFSAPLTVYSHTATSAECKTETAPHQVQRS